MKKRNPFAVFILSIITLGIYDLYWLVVTKKELNAKTSIHTPTIWMLFAPVILVFAAFIALIAGSHSTTLSTPGTSAAPVVAIIVYVLAIILTLVTSFYWFFKFSKAVNEYTSGKMSTGLSFVLLWIVHLIGVAIVQDAFNDHLEMPQTSAGAAPPMAGTAAMPPSMPQQPPMNGSFVSPEPQPMPNQNSMDQPMQPPMPDPTQPPDPTGSDSEDNTQDQSNANQ